MLLPPPVGRSAAARRALSDVQIVHFGLDRLHRISRPLQPDAHLRHGVGGAASSIDEVGSMAVVDAWLAHFLHVEMFRGLKPLQITEIARRAERIVFRPGQALIEIGQAGDAALLVISDGAVRTRGPGGLTVAEPIEPGSLVGEMAMLIETEHTSTVVAEGSVRAFRITRDNIAAQMSRDASLAEHFVDKIAGRLHRLADELRKIEASLAPASPAPMDGPGPEIGQLTSGAAG